MTFNFPPLTLATVPCILYNAAMQPTPANYNDFLNALQQAAEPSYAAFAGRLIPQCSRPLLGVRLPLLRKLAKQIAKAQGLSFFDTAPAPVFFEDAMVRGMLLGYVPHATPAERCTAIDRVLPLLDNWSLVDSCCATYHFAAEHRRQLWPWLRRHALSRDEFRARFGMVMLLDHYLADAAWAARTAELLPRLKAGRFYTDMAAAWCACEIILQHPALAPQLSAEGFLSAPVRQLTLRKLRESRRKPHGGADSLTPNAQDDKKGNARP